ncbi:MAG: GH3 auxin-responsive promoter family protein, partial [Dehalococcoidia bacterium]
SRLAPQVDDSQLPMSQRAQTGLWRSLETGVDCVVGMTSTLLLARREFERMAANTSFRQLLSEVGTRAAFKWAFGKMRRLGRKQAWLPKSLLSPKAVITWGADTSILAPTLADHWGAPVFELYASSESGIIAMQDWRRDGLIPLPTSVFLEFLPAGEQPDHEATLLLNELEEGKVYEPIITSFYGMPFLRMRQGDLLQVVGRNEHRVPKFVFKSRADDIIDLGSIARIDRATLSEAMDMVGVKEGEWQARKEYLEGRPVMCLYIEPGPDDTKELSRKLHRALGKVDPHYREASYTLRYPLIRVSPASVEAVPTNGSSPS